MVCRGTRAVDIEDTDVPFAKSVESLGACDFVNKMAVDEKRVGMTGCALDNVAVPDFFEDGFWLIHNKR